MKTPFAIVTLSAALAACSVAPPQQDKAAAAEGRLPPAAQAVSDAVYVLGKAELDAREGRWQQAVDALMAGARATRDARLARRAAEIASAGGGTADSAAAARLWFELEPTAPAADAYARASLAAGDYASAGTALSQIVGRSTDAARGFALRYALGVIAARGEHADGAAVLEQVAGPYEGQMEAQVLLAEAARWRGDREAAREHARRAVALDQRSPFAVLALAQASERGDELAVLERFLKANPGDADVRDAYGRMLARHGRADDARRELSRVLEVRPDDWQLLYMLGLVEMRAGDAAAAERHLARAVELDGPNRNAALIALAAMAQDRGDVDAASAWLDKADAGADDLDLQFMRASVAAAKGDLDGARRMLGAIEAPDEATRAKVIVAEAGMLSQAGQDAAGYAKLKQGIGQYPDNEELLYLYALAAEQAGDMGEAERTLRLLIRRDPGSAQMLNALGYLFADRNMNLREARKLITAALRIEPQAESIIDSMGWLEYRAGNLKAAERLLRKAWAKRHDGDIGAHLAEVLWKRGKKAEARKLLREVKRIQPDSKTFRDTVARLGVKL